MSESHLNRSSPDERFYIAFGSVSALLAVFFLPVVFGSIAGYLGFRLHRDGAEFTGVAIALLGGLGLILGVVHTIILPGG